MITSYDQWRAFLGKQATVRGTLVHSTTGHHHTDALLEVTEIKTSNK